MKIAIAKAFMHAARFLARGYDGAESNYSRGDLAWGRRVPQDEDRYLTSMSRELIRQKLMDMRRNIPIVKGLCDRMCDFVAGPNGLQVQSITGNTEYDKEAEDYFADWCRGPDVTGRWPFRKIQRALVDARLWAGESFPMFLSDGKIQGIEAERIRHPFGDPETATEFDGMRLSGAVVRAWHVADRDEQGTFMKKLGRWVPSENIYHFSSPWRFDSIRALPELAAGVNVMTDVGEISWFTLAQIKRQAQVAGTSNTEGGTDIFAARGAKTAQAPNGMSVQKVDGAGLILRGLPGEKLELAQPVTPNPNLEGHLVFNLRQFCACVGIPYEVAMMDSTRGNLSQNKAVRELFSRVVESWQLDLADFVRYVWSWQIAHAIRTKQIRPAPVERGRSLWDKIDIQPPPSTWADPQDAADADSKNLQMGNITHESVIRRGGRARSDVWRKRAQEEAERQALAKEFGIDPDRISNVQIAGGAPSGNQAAAAGKETNETKN